MRLSWQTRTRVTFRNEAIPICMSNVTHKVWSAWDANDDGVSLFLNACRHPSQVSGARLKKQRGIQSFEKPNISVNQWPVAVHVVTKEWYNDKQKAELSSLWQISCLLAPDHVTTLRILIYEHGKVSDQPTLSISICRILEKQNLLFTENSCPRFLVVVFLVQIIVAKKRLFIRSRPPGCKSCGTR